MHCLHTGRDRGRRLHCHRHERIRPGVFCHAQPRIEPPPVSRDLCAVCAAPPGAPLADGAGQLAPHPACRRLLELRPVPGPWLRDVRVLIDRGSEHCHLLLARHGFPVMCLAQAQSWFRGTIAWPTQHAGRHTQRSRAPARIAARPGGHEFVPPTAGPPRRYAEITGASKFPRTKSVINFTPGHYCQGRDRARRAPCTA